MNPNPDQNQINIELPEGVAEGTYANLAVVSHSQSEMVIDFIRLMPNLPKARVQSRIIMSPENVKRLIVALQDNLRQYEQQFGKMPTNDTYFPPNMGGFGGGPASA
jgi:hypothetical protein